MLLDRFASPVRVCSDPECPFSELPLAEHSDRHNPRCVELFVGRDGTEMLCELVGGHEGPHRGTVYRDSGTPPPRA